MLSLPRYLSAGLLAFSLLVTSASAQNKPSGTPYKLGVLLPLTGSGSQFGDDGQLGLKVAINDINAHGGILGRPVVAVLKDDAGDSATAAKVALQLIQEDKVDAILGAIFSNTSAAVLPVTNDAKMIQIGFSYLADEGNAAKYPFVFKGNPTAASIGEAFAPYIKKLKLTKVGIINVDNLQGVGVANGVAEGLKTLGITLTGQQTMAQGATDVTPQLDKLHATGAQALVLAMAQGPDYVTVLKGLKQIGWSDAIAMGTSAINFAVVIKSAPPDILDHSYGSGGYRNLTVQCEPPAVKQFMTEISQTGFNGGPVTRAVSVMGNLYDGVMLVAQAANGAKSTSSAAIKSYLESHPHPGILGTYVYDGQRHDGLRAEDLVFVKAALPVGGLSELAPGQSCK